MTNPFGHKPVPVPPEQQVPARPTISIGDAHSIRQQLSLGLREQSRDYTRKMCRFFRTSFGANGDAQEEVEILGSMPRGINRTAMNNAQEEVEILGSMPRGINRTAMNNAQEEVEILGSMPRDIDQAANKRASEEKAAMEKEAAKRKEREEAIRRMIDPSNRRAQNELHEVRRAEMEAKKKTTVDTRDTENSRAANKTASEEKTTMEKDAAKIKEKEESIRRMIDPSKRREQNELHNARQAEIEAKKKTTVVKQDTEGSQTSKKRSLPEDAVDSQQGQEPKRVRRFSSVVRSVAPDKNLLSSVPESCEVCNNAWEDIAGWSYIRDHVNNKSRSVCGTCRMIMRLCKICRAYVGLVWDNKGRLLDFCKRHPKYKCQACEEPFTPPYGHPFYVDRTRRIYRIVCKPCQEGRTAHTCDSHDHTYYGAVSWENDGRVIRHCVENRDLDLCDDCGGRFVGTYRTTHNEVFQRDNMARCDECLDVQLQVLREYYDGLAKS